MMTKTKKKLGLHYLSEKFDNDFLKLINLKEFSLSKLLEHLKPQEGIIQLDENRLITLNRQSDINITDLKSIITVIEYIYSEALDKQLSTQDIISEIKEYIKVRELSIADYQLKLFRKLFEIKPDAIRKRQISLYENAVIPNLVSISALHELRAVFIDDQKNEFDSFIPMMIINIKTIDNDQNKKDLVFQTDLKSLKRFIEYLNNYCVKFSQLIARYENNIPIYYQSEPSKIEMKSEDDHSDK